MTEGTLTTLKRTVADFSKDFAWAPVDWIILGLLVIAAAGNWQKAQALTRTCDLLLQERVLTSLSHAQKDEIAALCIRPPATE